MPSRFDWVGIGPMLIISAVAVALTVWQVRIDRSVFERFVTGIGPTAVMSATAAGGLVAMAYLQGVSEFAVIGPGRWTTALSIIGWAVPLFGLAAIGADVAFGFAEDMNVEVPDAFRFYPAVAVFVEIAFHVVPIAMLVALVGPPSGLEWTFWRIAIPVALIETVLQTVSATSLATSIFTAVQLLTFGAVQVWLFWRFGFVWMLGFRLAYYGLWHVAWGAARLELLF